MKFACEKISGAFVYADEDPCGRYEPDRSRTNDMIAKYDRRECGATERILGCVSVGLQRKGCDIYGKMQLRKRI